MDWHIFLDLSSDGLNPWWRWLLLGLAWTAGITVGASTIALVLGSIVGVARTTGRHSVRRVANVYVGVLRSIPLVVQLFLWYFVLPELLPWLKALSLTSDPAIIQMGMAILCLGIYTSARVGEQVRAGVLSTARGARQASYALGMSEWQTYRYVLLPITFRTIMGPLTSEAMSLVKNTSVAYSIGLAELFSRTLEMGENTFHYFTAFVACAAGYMSIALCIAAAMGVLARRCALHGRIGGKS